MFIAGVADDQGFGWAIAKAMAEAGAELSLGVWVRMLQRVLHSKQNGSRLLYVVMCLCTGASPEHL